MIAPDPPPTPPTFGEAFRTWVRVGLLSFGGPAGQIAVMHRILVEEKRWISEHRFLHALNYCMLLPGPEAQQLATYVGWLLHRTAGGLTAGILFVLPGFVSILAISLLYAGYQDTQLVQALFFGLKPAVVAVVAEAVHRIGGRALKNRAMAALAAAAFVAIFFFEVPFPLIVAGAALVGYLGSRIRPDLFLVIRGHEADAALEEEGAAGRTEPAAPSWRAGLRTALLYLFLWWAPVGALLLLTGASSVWVQEGVFFSTAAVVTFGGAYAVLAYVAQQAVETYGWLRPGEMLDGLGMAETTPGPLIQVVQFVGFMGAYRNPGGLDPMLAGVLGSALTTWVTFVPCFLFIFVGAPWIEHLRGRKGLTAALSGITAAVVGVILNLALWFALHVLFARVGEARHGPLRLLVPEWDTLDPAALLIAAGAFAALFLLRWGMIRTLLAAAAAGLLYSWLG
ncbi:MAG TPA: chromate efflux transporter [Longimicrobiaceae bacterium]|nr:chromate efflux transporter [Longimicrobiaceae bacterium]